MNLNDALKYAAGEQEAFEKRIDQNPFDSDNHLIYADWLDDQGHAEEAAFRRAMGEWVRKGPVGQSKSGWGQFDESFVKEKSGEHHAPLFSLPEWAFKNWGESLETHLASVPHTADRPEDPAVARQDYNFGLRWPNYRTMEEGLRRAFRRHREQQ